MLKVNNAVKIMTNVNDSKSHALITIPMTTVHVQASPSFVKKKKKIILKKHVRKANVCNLNVRIIF